MKNLLILTLLLPLTTAGQGFRTTLKGTVTGRDSKALIMSKAVRDISTMPDSIPIVDGKFEYTFEGDHVMRYEISFIEELRSEGIFRVIPFLPDAEVVEFSFDGDKHEIKGGALNRRLDELRQMERHLWSNMPDEWLDLNKKMQVLRDAGKTWDDPEYKPLQDRSHIIEDSLWQADVELEYDMFEKADDLATYSMFVVNLGHWRYSKDLTKMDSLLAKFTAAHPGHPYNVKAAAWVNAHKMKTTGGRFVDFTAPDLDGNMHTLSEKIAGKVALIKLWWPLNAVPYFCDKDLYKEYWDKGFTVVFVVRARSDDKNFENELTRSFQYPWPWLTLIELDDKAGIWDKYGWNATLLIDREGKVIKVIQSYTEADEIREYLEKNLN